MDGKDYRIEEPFFVLATQNLIEQEGTYARRRRVDRFMFKLLMRYPTVEEMKQIVLMTQKTMDEVADGVVDGETLPRMRETAKNRPDDIINYTMRLVSSTQPSAGGGRTAARMICLARFSAPRRRSSPARRYALRYPALHVSHEDIDVAGPPGVVPPREAQP
ncbi:MAG: AAA family ATPase [Christensenellales bacterium]